VNSSTARGCFEALRRYGSTGEVGNRVIGQWQADMPGPTRGTEWRTSLGGERRLQSQLLEDAPDESRNVDRSNDRLGPILLKTRNR